MRHIIQNAFHDSKMLLKSVMVVHFCGQLLESKDQVHSANFVKCLVQAGAQQST